MPTSDRALKGLLGEVFRIRRVIGDQLRELADPCRGGLAKRVGGQRNGGRHVVAVLHRKSDGSVLHNLTVAPKNLHAGYMMVLVSHPPQPGCETVLTDYGG